jgi:uncharacterized protein YdeI (YjbR/CyaY-like superfamily)
MPAKAVYFASAAAFRDWLAANHASATELLVGFHKVGSGKPTLTWPESVDAALCYGWIDGRRTGVDATRYTIRFTPRRPSSIWSLRNIGRMKELLAAGLVAPAGERAFAARRDDRTAVYSFERRTAPELTAAQTTAFRANAAAWTYWSARSPSYRRAATHWVISAMRETTQASRLATLIADSARGRAIKPLARPTPKKKTTPKRRR